MVDFYGFHVGVYTSPMDPVGLETKLMKNLSLRHIYLAIKLMKLVQLAPQDVPGK